VSCLVLNVIHDASLFVFIFGCKLFPVIYEQIFLQAPTPAPVPTPSETTPPSPDPTSESTLVMLMRRAYLILSQNYNIDNDILLQGYTYIHASLVSAVITLATTSVLP
jgi:hypothetical protein